MAGLAHHTDVASALLYDPVHDPVYTPLANRRRLVARRLLNAGGCRVSPAPRDTDRMISFASARVGDSGGRSSNIRSAEPMMLIRMLLKSCASLPASRPIASSFCDRR